MIVQTLLSTIATFVWNIWKSRNKAVFDKCHFNMFISSSATFRMMNEVNVRFDSFLYPDVQNDYLAWKPPKIDFLKINFNGSFCTTSSSYIIGVVVLD